MGSRKTINPEVAKTAMEFYYGLFHSLSQDYNLDDLTRYIFKYCQKEMTADEQRATQYLAFIYTANASTNQKDQKFWQNQAKKLLDENIENLLKEGEETFLYKVRNRLMTEVGNKILNLCPKCGTLARTPQAKQCPNCFFGWHY